MIYYIKRKGQGYRETVDEFETRVKAVARLGDIMWCDLERILTLGGDNDATNRVPRVRPPHDQPRRGMPRRGGLSMP